MPAAVVATAYAHRADRRENGGPTATPTAPATREHAVTQLDEEKTARLETSVRKGYWPKGSATTPATA